MYRFNKNTSLRLFLGLTAAGMLVAGCDNVDENNRLIDYPLPEAGKVELIMEFTGQRCSNCPDGARVIHDLQEAYPDNIVAICLHPSGPDLEYTKPLGPDKGLRSELATELYHYYNPPSFPFALFDGMEVPQSRFFLQWSNPALNLVNAETPVVIESEASYDENRNITVNATCDFVRGSYPGPLNIAVWIMENGITARQLSQSAGEIRDYVHNHVARASLNGTWGESVGASFAFEQKLDYSVSLENADIKWVLDNCQVVVFLVDPASKNVIQTSLADLKPEASEES